MKNIFKKPVVLLLALAGLSTACTDMLIVQSYDSVTSGYLYSTPDGLMRAATAIYDLEKQLNYSDNNVVGPLYLDTGSDLTIQRSGANTYAQYNGSLTSDYSLFSTVWDTAYSIIGKANEIIAGAEELGVDSDDEVLHAWGEAKLFRARFYFLLYKKYERILLNTSPVTADNMELVYEVAAKDDVFALINDDLQDIIDTGALDWSAYEGQSGRLTMGVAMHVKAQVAMWEQDWDEVVELCEAIFARSEYSMMSNAIDCFTGADLNYAENLYVYQFSMNTGGYNNIDSSGTLYGQKFAKNTTPLVGRTDSVYEQDMDYLLSMGGYGWGRSYPNMYCISLFGDGDSRRADLIRETYYYPDTHSDETKAGRAVTVDDIGTGDNYLKIIHPMSMKNFDMWSTASDVSNVTHFKDVVIYRLAETYLMAAEAYMMKNDNTNAIRCYNMTWERANTGNPFTGTLTIDDIIDENARELHMEGQRWDFLKRLGILEERVKLYTGDNVTSDPNLVEGQAYADGRTYFTDKHWYWAIPLTQIEIMGSAFPQTTGWEN